MATRTSKFSSKGPAGDVVMPERVVIRTAAFFAAILACAQLALIAFYYFMQSPIPQQVPALVGILTSVVALPLICHSVFHAERNRVIIRQLNGFASTDTLTGVLNRAGFRASVDRVMDCLGSKESAGAFLYVDADNFKTINDTFGHHIGDHALSIIGGTLKAKIRGSDICGRIGGEEFGILLIGANFEQASFIAERIRGGVEDNGESIGEPGLKLTVSIGLAIHEPGQTASECMEVADRRLYEAKARGRNRIVGDLRLVEEAA